MAFSQFATRVSSDLNPRTISSVYASARLLLKRGASTPPSCILSNIRIWYFHFFVDRLSIDSEESISTSIVQRGTVIVNEKASLVSFQQFTIVALMAVRLVEKHGDK